MPSSSTSAFRNPTQRRYAAYGSTFFAAATSSYATVSARADIAYARSFLTQTHLKGTIGEFFAERYFLNNQLEQNIRGNWIPLTPRSGPQGLDHLFLKIGKNGRFYWMVGESKYGTSQLGTTVGGVRQLSTEWTSERIQKLGQQYLSLSTKTVGLKNMPEIPPKAQFDVPIGGGKTVSFWKDANDNWFFTGTMEELRQAQSMAQKMGNSLASTGCNIRVRLFHIVANGNDLKITLYQVKPNEVTTIAKMVPSSEFTVEGILGQNISDKEFCKLVSSALKNKFPNMTEAELKDTAQDILKKYKAGEFLAEPRPLWQSVALQSLSAAGIAGVVDIGFQFVMTRRVDIGHVFLTAASAGIGAASGQIVGIILIKTSLGISSVRSISSFVNVGSGLTRSAIAGLSGGAVTTLLMAYGSLALGYCDAKQANRMAVSGLAGTIASTAVAVGVPSAVSTMVFGSLHGAAATSATMAWLGFGSIANGGLGMAGGAMLLGGYAVVAGMVVSAIVSYGYRKYDEYDNRQYLILLADRYENASAWEIIAARNPLRQ